MAVTVSQEATGTLSSTGSGTEDTIFTENTAGVYRAYISLENLLGVNATILVREYVQLANAGAWFLVNQASYHGITLSAGGGSEDPAIELPTREVLFGYKLTLEDGGSSKDFLWLEVEIG